jgi:anti-sigma B factor antagonist
MNFRTENREKYTIVAMLVEKLDGTVSPSLKSEFVMVNAGGIKNIILDVGSTRYCDSSGLSAILVGNRLCKNAGGTFIICGVQPAVKKLISISQLDNILNITPTATEAHDFMIMDELQKDISREG